ncbi:MAG TPA: sugar ABC transporter permease [Chthoniobacterales bacterium]|nr:sugar ABC transporter permease [Chthoniobacterales bacterium]
MNSKIVRTPSLEFKGMLFVSPWIVGFLWFYLFPFVASFYYSFYNATAFGPGSFIGLRNYELMLKDPLIWKSLINTFYFTAGSLGLGTALALFLALALPRNVRGVSLYRTIFYLPTVVPFSAVSVIWIWILHPQYGLLNDLLQRFGIATPGWLSDPSWAMPSLILVSAWSIGNMMVIYLAAIMEIPTDLYEAAKLDGASSWQRLIRITIPMLTPVILFNLIIGLIGGFQYFVQPYVMTGGGPADATLVYSLYLYRNAFQFFRMGYASAMGWMLFLLILALTAILLMSARRWVHYRG